ncbi:MAG: hypothetical protein D6824_01675 [Planctomycetota bacterium]|nr:MAG: hypothetical protein D6824_01675 [Planctomycetota bacterium]
MHRRHSQHSRALLLAALALTLLALAPSRLTGWIRPLQDPAIVLVAPVSHSAAAVARLLRPAVKGPAPPAKLREILLERDRLQRRYLVALQRIEDLEQRVESLQRGVPVEPELDVTPVVAPVMGGSSDPRDGVLMVRAGLAQGIQPRVSVAVAAGEHLVGRVVDVRSRHCYVLPITRLPQEEWIQGAVITDDKPLGWLCQLRAVGDGTLRGDLEADAVGVAPGQLVRLKDPSWPQAAQMLTLGRIVQLTPKPDAPLRTQIVVRPVVDIERVSEVILRTPAPQGGSIAADGAAEDGP